MKKILVMLYGLSLSGIVSASAPVTAGTENLMLAKGPPAHAPAHGYRRKQAAYRYRYYPDAEVYFDPSRSLYFYLDGGRWTASASLPGRLTIHLGGAVDLEMDLDKPYRLHSEHLKLHPPGVKIKRR